MEKNNAILGKDEEINHEVTTLIDGSELSAYVTLSSLEFLMIDRFMKWLNYHSVNSSPTRPNECLSSSCLKPPSP